MRPGLPRVISTGPVPGLLGALLRIAALALVLGMVLERLRDVYGRLLGS